MTCPVYSNKQQTTNNKQQTTNNKQQTTNNKQQTTSQGPTPNMNLQKEATIHIPVCFLSFYQGWGISLANTTKVVDPAPLMGVDVFIQHRIEL